MHTARWYVPCRARTSWARSTASIASSSVAISIRLRGWRRDGIGGRYLTLPRRRRELEGGYINSSCTTSRLRKVGSPLHREASCAANAPSSACASWPWRLMRREMDELLEGGGGV